MSDTGRNLALKLLKQHEGFRSRTYLCPAGYWTVGYGRNLESRGVTEAEATYLLTNDVDECTAQLRARFEYFQDLDPIRQAILVDMAVNMGIGSLARFLRMHAAIAAGDYERAADEMVRSRWYGQVGRRSARLVKMMRTGQSPV